MAENSKIEWCDHTVNLWWGCSKVHTGCKNCYAEYFSDVRYKNDLWGVNKQRKRIKSAFSDLDRYQKQASEKGVKLKIFVGSMMDIFEESLPLKNPVGNIKTTGDLRSILFNRIRAGLYENLIFLFLTKRPGDIHGNVHPGWYDVGSPSNVWFGTSISDQETANKFVTNLRWMSPFKSNLFLSVEPQIGRIVHIDFEQIRWVIQGGESGRNKREFNLEWAYKMKEMCAENSVPYFFKQVDKVRQIPDDLMVREFPKEFN